MDWTQVFTIIGANIILFFWLRTEANSDRRELRGVLDQMKDEMKEFHGRMCSLEERYLQIISRNQKTDP